MAKSPTFSLGAWRQLDGTGGGEELRLPAKHLVTHACITGMTGSGKTGLVTVLVVLIAISFVFSYLSGG